MSEVMKTRKLKIMSDGTPKGTSVVDAETGEPIADVMKVMVEISSKEVTTILTIRQPQIEMTIDAKVPAS